MTAKCLAIRDIKVSLKQQGKCFMAFHSELNPIMDKLVSDQLKAQRKLTKFHPGDHIEAIEQYKGFERATVLSIKNGKYHLKIMNGIAIIPISAEVNYRKVRK